ncbi:MAG: hypothetical protein H7287_04455 [Thermoleophilia bacterium]|nr:hypothetical protein [Thermoleophilia bacterium]
MSWASDIHAGWIAVSVGIGACIVVAAFGLRAWNQYRSLERTRHAAEALIDVHAQRLETTIVTAGSHVARLGEHAGGLTESIAELRTNGEHLGWMLGRTPEARDRLQRELLDIVLPTRRGAAREDDRKPARD